MVCLKEVIFIGVLLAGASCSDDFLIGDLPGAVIDELIEILTGGLTLIGQCDPPQAEDINLLLYTRSHPNNPTTLNTSNLGEVDPTKKVVLLIHGWLSGPTIIGTPELKDAYLQRYDCNLIVVDWSKLAKLAYTTSYCDLPGIASLVTDFLCQLSSQLSIPLNSVHLVGHSLGAQMSGFIGTFAKATCNQQIGRITGLDPAGPLYQGTSADKRLDASDAIFVDVIHTNALEFGYWGNCGAVDFYVNCGTLQGGCPDFDITNIANTLFSVVACSHLRALDFMTESVNSNDFKAISCSGCPLVCVGDIFNPSYITMGEDCPANPSKAVYVIPTNLSPPFAKGCTPYPSGCSLNMN